MYVLRQYSFFISSPKSMACASQNSFILNIYVAPLQENYSEALPTPAQLKRAQCK